MTWRTVVLALATAALAAAHPLRAAADGALDGAWVSGPLDVRYEVESWGPDCGPHPPATEQEPGGTVQVTQHGDDLTFRGAMRGEAGACWTANPEMRRSTTSYQSGRWVTVCQTPPNDPRSEHGTYALRLTEDGRALVQTEVTRYDWELKRSRCVATRRAERTLRRPAAAAPPPRCVPGHPATVELRPSSAHVDLGGRVCFRGRVLDAKGCEIDGAPVRLDLEAPKGRAATLAGACFTARSGVAEGVGSFRVVAQSGSLRAESTVVVDAPDLARLTARRERERTEARSVGAETEGAAGVIASAARLSGDGPLGVSRAGWLAVIAALLSMLGAGVLVRRRRAGRANAALADHSTDGLDTERRGATDSAKALPDDAPEVCVDPEREAGMICPRCRLGHPPEAERCARDGTPLVPYRQFASGGSGQSDGDKPRVCPKCGQRYAAHVAFCGKDGTALPPLR
ncbi:MAG: hypothetical protein KC543_16440 [Myxococcales bacterium]|nr:hypothetical protein [Myxococcales bacterium]